MAVMVIGVGVWFALVRMRPLSAKEVAEIVAKCLENGDGACVYRYAYEREKELNKLTPARAQWLLDQFYVPGFAGYKPVDRPVITSSSASGYYSISQAMKDGQGRLAYRDVDVVETDDGPRVLVVGNLVLGGFAAMYGDTATDKPMNVRKNLAWLRGLELDGPRLEAAGFSGFVWRDPSRLTTWKEFAQRTRAVLASLENSNP